MLATMATQAPVTLIVGEEEFLVDRTVRELVASARAAMAAGDGGGDLHDVDASALTPGELTSLTSPSLFGGGCVVIVRSAQNAGKEVAAELVKYTAAPPPDAVAGHHARRGSQGEGAGHRPDEGRGAGGRVPEADPGLRADGLRAGRVPAGRPGRRRGRGPRAARRDRLRPAGAGVGGGPARLRHRGADRRGRRGQVLPGPGGGDRVQRGRPRGRGTAERGARAAPLGAGDRRVAGPDQQRAGRRACGCSAGSVPPRAA